MASFKFIVSAALAASLVAALAAHAAVDPQSASVGAGLEVSPTPGSMAAQSAMGTRPVMPVTAFLGGPGIAAPATGDLPPAPLVAATPAPSEPAATPAPGAAMVVSNGPVPDTAANRAKYGQPLSRAGQATDPAGN